MIKFIYFDVGGVVVKDFSGTNKWVEMKKVMGVKQKFDKEFDRLYNQYEIKELCLTRHVDTLIPIFAEKFSMGFPQSFSMLEYFIDHFEKNRSLWPLLEKVKKNYGIGLLTNMYIDMLDGIRKKGLLPPIDWDVVIDSSKAGLQKPDRRIYGLAEKKSGVNSEEILFVENSQKNIDAAKKLGWQTFLYDSSAVENASRELGLMLDSDLRK
jgi:epoxide hydrolase-like predicted phosphatase